MSVVIYTNNTLSVLSKKIYLLSYKLAMTHHLPPLVLGAGWLNGGRLEETISVAGAAHSERDGSRSVY